MLWRPKILKAKRSGNLALLGVGRAGVAANALLTNLISYWKMDEASGNALDAYGSNTLTDNNTVGSAAGVISNARQFIRANTEYLSHADNADLSVGDIDFTFAFWLNLASQPAGSTNYYFITKSGSTEPYAVYYEGFTPSRLKFSTANFAKTVTSALQPLSTGTWYFVVVWHDSVADTINIQINDGSVDSLGTGGAAPSDDTGVFQLGTYAGGGAYCLDGLMDEVGFWKRVLTTGERTQLYNSGAGLPYSSFT